MNSVELEQDIRDLELMLHGGGPLRPGVVFGRVGFGHFDGADVRAAEVRAVPATEEERPDSVLERYIIDADGDLALVTGKSGEGP